MKLFLIWSSDVSIEHGGESEPWQHGTCEGQRRTDLPLWIQALPSLAFILSAHSRLAWKLLGSFMVEVRRQFDILKSLG